jgi:uncharacterized protein (TIGR03032 family)
VIEDHSGTAVSGKTTAKPTFKLTASRQFTSWLAEQRASVAFTTYQAGKLFLIGLKPDGGLSVFERTFNRCMGLWADGQSLVMSSLYQLWRFENALEPGQVANGYDRVYIPQLAYTTGDLDIHDLAVDGDGRILFVNTLFGCLARPSERHSFVPVWRPPFISRLAAEDRCHLNGLALADGQPRYVTVVSQSDVADGWRDRRRDGGCLLEVPSGEAVVSGLSMPHSPRLHDGRLYMLESGTGQFGWVNLEAGKFEPIAFCPGYARGLSFVGNFALVGLSRPRENSSFSGLPLDDNLAKRDAEARCGVLVIDLRTGDTVQWLRIEGVVQELYDVVVLPGVGRPMALGFKTDEIHRMITVGEAEETT